MSTCASVYKPPTSGHANNMTISETKQAEVHRKITIHNHFQIITFKSLGQSLKFQVGMLNLMKTIKHFTSNQSHLCKTGLAPATTSKTNQNMLLKQYGHYHNLLTSLA
ncbi:hypothetical protein SLEP1_g26143 [Rubroshorea leprosula]|uniref:Uncharacterized protein n=1 Tax=Rubroshorea leprosula TaxID=152421 RepID=A0AAV5JXB3_9ROSI|nr:hypothetical protein SLEP1_g26143 [Rubroshorea leprosula]